MRSNLCFFPEEESIEAFWCWRNPEMAAEYYLFQEVSRNSRWFLDVGASHGICALDSADGPGIGSFAACIGISQTNIAVNQSECCLRGLNNNGLQYAVRRPFASWRLPGDRVAS
jgi:hypothetical protein